MGNSAGALVLCKEVVITKDKDNPKTEIVEGLGLVDFSAEVHYNGSNGDELIELAKERTIYAIAENSAIIYDGSFEFIGKVCVFNLP